MMRRLRGLALCSVGLPVLAALVSFGLLGCSGETTKVAEGDPVARRKQKDDAMERMLNPTGAPAPKAKGKGKAKADPFADKPLP